MVLSEWATTLSQDINRCTTEEAIKRIEEEFHLKEINEEERIALYKILDDRGIVATGS